MDALFVVRGRAYLRDCLGYLGLAAATLPLGIGLRAAGWTPEQGAVWALSAIGPVLATVLAARRESGPTATPGKRRTGLRVVTTGHDRPTFGRALLRNTVKIAIPWQLGHTVAIGAAFGGFDRPDPTLVSTTAATYGLVAALIVTVGVTPGRGLHDRVAGTWVVPGASGRTRVGG